MTDKRIVFHITHLDVMDVRLLDRDSVLCLENVRVALQTTQDAITLIYDGRILACMGFWMPFPGVAEVWLIPSIYVSKAPKFFVREVNRYLVQLAQTFDWHRVQTVTRADDFHRRWMKALKFEEEGVMRKYFNGQDFIMSARFFKEEQV